MEEGTFITFSKLKIREYLENKNKNISLNLDDIKIEDKNSIGNDYNGIFYTDNEVFNDLKFKVSYNDSQRIYKFEILKLEDSFIENYLKI